MLPLNLGQHGGSVTVDNVGTIYRYGDGVAGLITDQWRIFVSPDGSEVVVRRADKHEGVRAIHHADHMGGRMVLHQGEPYNDNKSATEGCSRCECGCKYWEGDRCIDCGTVHDSARHDDW